MANFPTLILDCGYHSSALLDLFTYIHPSICSTVVSPIRKLYSCCYLNFCWLSFKLKMDAPFHRTDYGYSWADWYCQFSWCFDRWDKLFKNGPSKICGRQSLKKLKGYCCLSKPYPSKFFTGCLPQILLGPFLNTLSKMCHWRIPLNSTLLLQVLNFANGSRLEFMYMSGQASFISMVVSCLWCSHSS